MNSLPKQFAFGLGALAGLAGLGTFSLYRWEQEHIRFRQIQQLQLEANLLAMSNAQLLSACGLHCFTVMDKSIYRTFDENSDKLKFEMKMCSESEKRPFARLLVNASKFENIWLINSILAKLNVQTKSNEWQHLFQALYWGRRDSAIFKNELDSSINTIAYSSAIQDPNQCLTQEHKENKNVLWPIELLWREKETLDTIGTPVCLTSVKVVDRYWFDLVVIDLQGTKRKATLVGEFAKKGEDPLKAVFVWYDLDTEGWSDTAAEEIDTTQHGSGQIALK